LPLPRIRLCSGLGSGSTRRHLHRSPEIREFQKIENTWSSAINERDQYSLELVLSPLFVDVSAVGTSPPATSNWPS